MKKLIKADRQSKSPVVTPLSLIASTRKRTKSESKSISPRLSDPIIKKSKADAKKVSVLVNLIVINNATQL